MGFLITYTSWLLPLCIIGLVAQIYGLIVGGYGDNITVPIMGIVIGIWVTLFDEGWTRMEAVLAF